MIVPACGGMDNAQDLVSCVPSELVGSTPTIQTISKRKKRLLIAYSKGYRVNSSGNVFYNGRILKRQYDKDGYLIFSVYSDGHRGCVGVHQLMAYQIFHDDMLVSGIIVRHLDGNHLNNHPFNISIGTYHQNIMDRSKEDRIISALNGADKVRRLTYEQADQLRKDRKDGMNYKELIDKYGIAKSTVSYIVNCVTYRKETRKHLLKKYLEENVHAQKTASPVSQSSQNAFVGHAPGPA